MAKYEFPKGAEEIEKSANREPSEGGKWRPFIQNFFWKDGDERYLLFLNPIGDIPKVMMQEVWLSNGRKAYAIARTTPAIGEKKDPIQDTWQYKPVERYVAVAVELEPEMKEVRGRPRPVGFTVATRKFDRKVWDDEGKDTGETEEVQAPVVGMVIQSASNFFRHVAHADAKKGPITECAVQVTRLGGGTDTDYNVDMFEDLDVDLTNLLEYFDGISYLSEEELDTLSAIEDDQELVAQLGSLLLDKRLDEMSDREYYDEILDEIDEPARFAKENKPSGSSRRAQQGRNRQSRPSQKRSEGAETSSESASEADNHDGNAPETDAKPRARRRATKQSPVADRLAELRAEGEAVTA
jgi:hypothetical protein